MRHDTVQSIVDDDGYQFFGCYKCGELISAIRLAHAMNTTGISCRCGCSKVQPVQVKPEQFVLKQVVEMGIWLKFNEVDYIADFRAEMASIPEPWTFDQIEEGVHQIRTHFRALLEDPPDEPPEPEEEEPIEPLDEPVS